MRVLDSMSVTTSDVSGPFSGGRMRFSTASSALRQRRQHTSSPNDARHNTANPTTVPTTIGHTGA